MKNCPLTEHYLELLEEYREHNDLHDILRFPYYVVGDGHQYIKELCDNGIVHLEKENIRNGVKVYTYKLTDSGIEYMFALSEL